MYNGIERNEEFGLNIYTADFRSYDPAIGRWMQIDPFSEIAYGWTSYRFGFNNPVRYSDPWGLFESRREAKKYRRENDLRGRIRKNDEGGYDIRLRKSDGFITKSKSGEIQYGVVATSLEPTSYGRPPEYGTWEAQIYTYRMTEDMKYVWIYKGSQTPYEPPENLAHGFGRTFAGFGMIGGVGLPRIHHLASNKHKSFYTPLFKQIAGKYGLKLNRKWNRVVVSSKHHYSSHPNQYHDLVLDAMQTADQAANGDPTIFKETFRNIVINAIKANPDILNKKRLAIMKYFFLGPEQNDDAAVAYTKGPSPISYELIPLLEGKKELPFDLFLRKVSLRKSNLEVSEDLSGLQIFWQDFLPNCLAWPLMSEKMKNIVESELSQKEGIDWVSVRIYLENKSRNYFIPRFARKLDVLDLEITIYVPGTKNIMIPCFSLNKICELSMFHKPVSTNSWKIPSGLYINGALKHRFEYEKVTGVTYEKVKISS